MNRLVAHQEVAPHVVELYHHLLLLVAYFICFLDMMIGNSDQLLQLFQKCTLIISYAFCLISSFLLDPDR